MGTLPVKSRQKPFSIVIDQAGFFRALRPILVDVGSVATCRVQRRALTRECELILDRWTVQTSLPNGQTLPPLTDWGLLAVDASPGMSPEELIRRIQPKRSQFVVAICLNPDNYRNLPIVLYDQGKIIRPETIRFIGSGMLTLPEPPSRPRTMRDSRTAGALRDQYDRVACTSLALVGAGRGGQQLASHLVSIGLRRLLIIDGDRIGPENLDAMPLADIRETNQLKVFQLARALRRNQPELLVSCVPHSILHPNAVRAIRQTRVDAIMSFVDSDAARLAVSRLCQESKTIHVDVGTRVEWTADASRSMSADVRLFQPGQGCIACCPPMAGLDDALYELAAPSGAMRRGRPRSWDELRAGSLLTLNSVASALAVETWLSWLAGAYPSSHWTRMFWNAHQTPVFDSGTIGPDPECPFCNML